MSYLTIDKMTDFDNKLHLDPIFRTVSETAYCNLIPKEMELNRLNKMCKIVFGINIIPIYQERKLFEKQSIIITEFCSNGFFWAQFEDELISEDFQNVVEIIGNYESKKTADLTIPWCFAKFEDEWFRGYIEEKHEDDKFKIFFIDYGTTAIVNRSDTRSCSEDALWLAPPLAVPFVIKDISLKKLNKFKEMQYSSFVIDTMSLINKTCIFEVELRDKEGNSLVSVL